MLRVLALVVAAVIACDSGRPGGAATSVPEAEVYDRASAFEGEWLGESDGAMGTLKIERLGALRYYASFAGEDGSRRYVANMQQATVSRGEGEGEEERTPANLVRFTWLDGRGGAGSGWLLINREDSALTGMLAYGQSQSSGSLSFVRRETAE